METSAETIAPIGEQVAACRNRLAQVRESDMVGIDPALPHLVGQLDNHLKHVSYSFRVAGSRDSYPYDLPRESAYPAEHTEWALARTDRFFDLLNENEPEIEKVYNFSPELGVEARHKQDEIVRNMLDNPLETYDDFTARRNRDGDNAAFQEMGWTIKALASDLVNMNDVDLACAVSPMLRKLRATYLEKLSAAISENHFGYGDSLALIEDTMTFFDLVVRVNDPNTPPPYHSARFEYNWHSLKNDTEHTILPTMASLSLEDLIRLRGVPVGLIGVTTTTLTVDGFPQTPYEMFHHDVDHTRRMHLETIAAVVREGITQRQYAEQATGLMEKLLPLIDLSKFKDIETLSVDEQAEYDRTVARLLVLFEVLHEDGYDCTRDSIADAITRAPMGRTPFEHESEDNVIEYYTAPRASLLAHVFRKLTGNFYDMPDNRSKALGSDFVRSRQAIVQAAADLYRAVSDNPMEDEDLLTTCRELVSTDEGFTDAFLGNFAHAIKSRAAGRNALKLMVTVPLDVNAAVHSLARKYQRKGMNIHTLFGYSALGYEDPEALEAAVLADLQQLDPKETAIAIGATPYGIGQMYPIAKELGFRTLGIVSSVAVGLGEESSEAVDDIMVVNDPKWGGYRYDTSERGLLTPTTRVFTGASDSIAAYGGGQNTAAAIREMRRKAKPVSFLPFDMNHRNANMMAAQQGDTNPIDYSGPAAKAWAKI